MRTVEDVAMKRALCIVVPLLSFAAGIGVGFEVQSMVAAHYAREIAVSNAWKPDNREITLPVGEHEYEVAWSAALAELVGGEAEHRLPERTRVDVLTDKYAVEVAWVGKFEEGIGQALRYSYATGKEPVVALGLKGDWSPEELETARRVCRKNRIHVWKLRAAE